MKKIILVRYGEIMLKGLNRPYFEERLVRNIKSSLSDLGRVDVIKSQGRIFIEPADDEYDFDKALDRLTRVFGIVSVSPVLKTEADFDSIQQNSVLMVKKLLEKNNHITFKVETKRGDKTYPMKSPEISKKLGAHILRSFPRLSVDVHNPDFILFVEVRDHAYIFTEIIPANGGMPTGTNGKAVLLLSGGIDSPVAGWMVAKRGVEIEAVHFYSYPYTSERSKDKVIDLTRILSEYCGAIRLHIVPFTEIQLEINEKCPVDQLTIIMRRFMMRIAEIIARKNGCQALVTGESLGQVASQTMESIVVTDSVVNMPVFRPLIGMDKNEVINIAKKINTYETSILPYEDCCTVFVAKHPQTRPRLEKTEHFEKVLDTEGLINRAVENTEILTVTSRDAVSFS